MRLPSRRQDQAQIGQNENWTWGELSWNGADWQTAELGLHPNMKIVALMDHVGHRSFRRMRDGYGSFGR